ncbi:MAPEG family protein [Sphingomonas sp. UV9]|uniref:MAPEG family protein n=1 Tax=Sphingomonas sp. UV9 TaxID=1851410 RepID=UPI000FFB9B29|nr:MAPEG family protein [Sphingomonas sp. UV9]RXD03524.1 MAPEG family protein [Sphingomonas sp. UV9]
MILPVTLTIAAAAAVVNLWLAFRIVTIRLKDKVLLGDNGDTLLQGRMRAHANFTEYAPFILILLGLIELAGGSTLWLWIAGVVFVIARIAHAFGMDRTTSSPARAGGALATWALMALLAVWAVAIAYQANAVPAAKTFQVVPSGSQA